jgi:murein DD-endopeptidase MepM/ murein hydrolase activator NlpD
VDGEKRIALERDASGRVFRGLVGVDLGEKAGAHEIVLEAGDGGARLVVPLKVRRGRFRVQKLSVDPRYVEVPPAEEERVKAETVRVHAAYESGEAGRRWSSFGRPLKGRSNRNFGARRVYNGKTERIHAGLDMAAAEGTPVGAAADGRVALAGDLYFSGGTVLLDHGGGLFTQYFHLSRVDVKDGDVVKKGTVLGLVGATGRATGPHLHWGAKLHAARVNPEALLRLPAWPLPAADAAR